MIDHNVESSAYHLRGRDTFLLYLSQFVSLETAGILTINLSTRDVYLEFHEGSYILPSKQTSQGSKLTFSFGSQLATNGNILVTRS